MPTVSDLFELVASVGFKAHVLPLQASFDVKPVRLSYQLQGFSGPGAA
jgi:hypothetical protein